MDDIDTTKGKIIELCEGNPGALTVLLALAGSPELYDHLLEHGPRGSQIWVEYKDEHGEDIEAYRDTLLLRVMLGDV